MKRINKNYLIGLGTIVSTSIPICTTISCTTTWTHWTPMPSEETRTIFHRTKAPQIKWKVRQEATLMNAWNSSTSTLDLNMVNNQFELISILTKILSISTSNRIDSYWNDYNSMKTFLNQIKRRINFKIQYEGVVQNIAWNVGTIIDNAVSAIDSYVPRIDRNPGPTLLHDINRAWDIEGANLPPSSLKGLSPDGTPKDFMNVARIGAPMTSIPIVQGLLNLDGSFALSLSKLVNLPKETFEQFKNLLSSMDTFLNNVWIAIKKTSYISDKGIDFRISSNGTLNSYNIESKYEQAVQRNASFGIAPPTEQERKQLIDNYKLEFIKGNFIISAFKH